MREIPFVHKGSEFACANDTFGQASIDWLHLMRANPGFVHRQRFYDLECLY